MAVGDLIKIINKLAELGYKHGYVSERTPKGMLINAGKPLKDITESDIEHVTKDAAVDKEKAIHFSAYYDCPNAEYALHVVPQYITQCAVQGLSVRACDVTDARALGAKLMPCRDNVMQITDRLIDDNAAMTDKGLYIVSDDVRELLQRLVMLEDAARLYASAAFSGRHSVVDKRTCRRLRAHAIRKHNITSDSELCRNGGGMCAILSDEGIKYRDNYSGDEVLLCKKTARFDIQRMVLAAFAIEGVACVNVTNSFHSLLMAATTIQDMAGRAIDCKASKDNIAALKQALADRGYCYITGIGLICAADSFQAAITLAKTVEKQAKTIAKEILAKLTPAEIVQGALNNRGNYIKLNDIEKATIISTDNIDSDTDINSNDDMQ